jgi:hypothetical protein
MSTLVLDVIERLRRFGCGHTDVFRFERGRVWLECLECGRQSPGLVTSPGTGQSIRGAATIVSRVTSRSVGMSSAA